MDQPPLSLKLFKKSQSKTKEKTLFLRRRERKNKQKEKTPPFFDQKLFIKLKKGQVLIETLFVIISLLAFLLAVQFFQSFARREIQKQRITKDSFYKIKNLKSPWHK